MASLCRSKRNCRDPASWGTTARARAPWAKLLAGLLEPAAGTIDVEGKARHRVCPAPEMVRLVGYLSTSSPSRMFFNQTVAEELGFTPQGPSACRTASRSRTSSSLISLTVPPHDLSAGQTTAARLGVRALVRSRDHHSRRAHTGSEPARGRTELVRPHRKAPVAGQDHNPHLARYVPCGQTRRRTWW